MLETVAIFWRDPCDLPLGRAIWDCPGAAMAGKINAMPFSVWNRPFDGQPIKRIFLAKKEGIILSISR
jgi:hypothetical protein